MINKITFDKIAPFARLSRYMTLNENAYYSTAIAYDHRLVYAFEGEGKIVANDITYNIKNGDLLLWQSGIPYELAKSNTELRLIAINFDFTSENAHLLTPVPPDDPQRFDKNRIIEKVCFSDVLAFNTPLYVEKMQKLLPYLIELIEEYDTRRLYYNKKCSALLQMIFTLTARSLLSNNSLKTDEVVNKIIEYIQQNFDKEINNVSIGRQLNFHPNYLNKLIANHTGVSLHQYLLNFRLTKAMDLLQTTDMNIEQIAHTVGFNDINHFSKYFKQKNGAPPSKFR